MPETDKRIYRVWYTSKDVNKKDWNEVEKSHHIFLSRAPLTFGHSQLVIPKRKNKKFNEEIAFSRASIIIQKAIFVFKEAFVKQKVHEKENFKVLATMTYTCGEYIKTLILKASADEDIGEKYKVHLVPYFSSHESLCKKRYQSLHKVSECDRGGLLGWLGKRENVADSWEKDLSPWKYKLKKDSSEDLDDKDVLDDIANDDLKMKELAKKLRAIINKNHL